MRSIRPTRQTLIYLAVFAGAALLGAIDAIVAARDAGATEEQPAQALRRTARANCVGISSHRRTAPVSAARRSRPASWQHLSTWPGKQNWPPIWLWPGAEPYSAFPYSRARSLESGTVAKGRLKDG